MSRPTSELQWSPDAVSGRGVWLLWFGAPWNYRVDWGDGTSDDRGHWQPAVKHTYPTVGTYTVSCTPDLPGGLPVRCAVTVREFRAPQATFTLDEDQHTVRAHLPTVGDPVRWRIDWGDGAETEHGAGETPEHTYPWEFGTPTITVLDAPARRSATFTGPEVGPEPPRPVPKRYQGFCWEFLSATSESRLMRMHGGGLTPGEQVTYYPTGQQWVRTIQADEHGEVHADLDIGRGVHADFDDSWRSYGVTTASLGQQFLPFHGPSMETGTPEVTYQLDPDHPRRLVFSVFPALPGRYTVDFGDGTATHTIDVDRLPLLVEHTFTGTATRYTVTVTLPDGRTATREVVGSFPCPPCYNDNYPGQCSVCWQITGGWCGACGQRGGDAFSPIVITNGVHRPQQIHKPERGSAWHVCYGYRGLPAGYHTFTYATPLHPPARHGVDIERASRLKTLTPSIELIQVDEAGGLVPQFHQKDSWDGGYSGEFLVTNDGEEASGPWLLEFELAPDARTAEVWPLDRYELAHLGNGRWRVSCAHPIPASTTARVGVRVEPAGRTKSHPSGMRAREVAPREQ